MLLYFECTFRKSHIVIEEEKNYQTLTSFSFPRCSRDDLSWVWVPDDLPKEVWSLCCLSQPDVLCPGY